MSNKTNIQELGRQLYPNGRAFWMPRGSVFDRLNESLAITEATAFEDALSLLNSVVADNAEFENDVAAWEKRLGIITNPGVAMSDRVKAINLKLNYPVTDAPRQHYIYLQEQLQNAGFNVYVHENNFGGESIAPEDLLSPVTAVLHGDDTPHSDDTPHRSLAITGTYHSDDIEHGSTTLHGTKFDNIVANHIDRALDYDFVIGSNYRSTFYVAGETMPDFAIVNPAREMELRQMILQLKPVHTVALLFINFQ